VCSSKQAILFRNEQVSKKTNLSKISSAIRCDRPHPKIRAFLTVSDFVKHFCETMKTASVRDIRQTFPAVMRWIEEGEHVAITMRRKIVARLIPERPPIARNAPAPDFDSISKRIFGAKKFRGNLVDLEREGYDS
jgi:antitoxin (DNA-binding transcriptional repressor) of toxin-antitoxin stability system